MKVGLNAGLSLPETRERGISILPASGLDKAIDVYVEEEKWNDLINSGM